MRCAHSFSNFLVRRLICCFIVRPIRCLVGRFYRFTIFTIFAPLPALPFYNFIALGPFRVPHFPFCMFCAPTIFAIFAPTGCAILPPVPFSACFTISPFSALPVLQFSHFAVLAPYWFYHFNPRPDLPFCHSLTISRPTILNHFSPPPAPPFLPGLPFFCAPTGFPILPFYHFSPHAAFTILQFLLFACAPGFTVLEIPRHSRDPANLPLNRDYHLFRPTGCAIYNFPILGKYQFFFYHPPICTVFAPVVLFPCNGTFRFYHMPICTVLPAYWFYHYTILTILAPQPALPFCHFLPFCAPAILV